MVVKVERIIWQYWETRGVKPRYIDGLHEIAKRNSGVKIVLVTPDSLRTYLPDLEDGVLRIANLAHKADMIRTRLVKRYGGMWLDSDAVVLRDLDWLFDHLEDHEFVGFNNGCRLDRTRPWVRVNCFLSRPNGAIVSSWVHQQGLKLHQTSFRWSEVGAELLNMACLENRDSAEILPFEKISPVAWDEVEAFVSKDDRRAQQILEDCFIVMLSNAALQERNIPLLEQSVDEIMAGDTLLARILRRAVGR
jgi:Capsular polysaccharide synthesis protein